MGNETLNATAFNGTAYYGFLKEHRLMGSRCSKCGAVYAPPRPLCATCPDADLEWVELSGEGTLASYSVISIAPTAMIEAGYGRDNPYCSGVVQLAEGPRISAQILGVDVAHPETIAVGAPAKVAFIERGEGDTRKTFLAFEVIV